MADSSSFPILFTLGSSSRHDVLLLDPSLSVSDIHTKIESLIASSPNCKQSLDKYSKNKNKQEVKSVKVRWANEQREAKLWPQATVVTEENVEAVLGLVKVHGGRDVLEVEVYQEPMKEEDKKEEGEKKELPERTK